MFRWLLALFLSVYFLNGICADEEHRIDPTVASILQQDNAPDGIVFDIETLQPDALDKLASYVQKQIMLIKKKFPDVDIAVVSHGVEEFALQKKADNQSELHDTFSSLVKNQQVSVHVCGAVGGLKNLTQEDFPAFVSYSESGMAQINDYKALGYIVVPISQLTESQRKDLFEHKEKYLK